MGLIRLLIRLGRCITTRSIFLILELSNHSVTRMIHSLRLRPRMRRISSTAIILPLVRGGGCVRVLGFSYLSLLKLFAFL